MGYYGVSQYRGDYYRPRGDIFGDIGGFIGGAAKAALPILNNAFGPAGLMTGFKVATGQMSPMAALGTLIPGSRPTALPFAPSASVAPLPIQSPYTMSIQTVPPVVPAGFFNVGGPKGVTAGSGSAKQLIVPHPAFHKHGRRMNVLNPRALSRALRRSRGFLKFAKRTLKLVGEKRHVAGFKHKRSRR